MKPSKRTIRRSLNGRRPDDQHPDHRRHHLVKSHAVNVNIDAPGAAVSVSGQPELVITGTNILRSGDKPAGLEKADDDGTLTIDGTGFAGA